MESSLANHPFIFSEHLPAPPEVDLHVGDRQLQATDDEDDEAEEQKVNERL